MPNVIKLLKGCNKQRTIKHQNLINTTNRNVQKVGL